jgi:opine dehydrogenase
VGKLRFAIIGAGNGGQAFAAHLGLLGCHVHLYDIEPEKVAALRQVRRIRLEGALKGEAEIPVVTGDLGEAILGSDIVMVVIPTVYQGSIAEAMARHLASTQTVILNPGATGGALEVRNTLRRHGGPAEVTVAETDTLLYACRSLRPGEVVVHGVKENVGVATLPGSRVHQVTAVLNTVFPQFRAISSVLVTSLCNPNAMVHPAPTLLNAGRIESQSPFDYYSDGVTPSLARVVERIDAERLAVARALGVEVPSIQEFYRKSYGVQGQSLHEQIQRVRAYDGIKGPTTLNTRYLFEDIPTGLVPLACLGSAVGVPTPTIQAVVTLGSALLGRDFWREGRTLEKLGLERKSPEEIRRVFME